MIGITDLSDNELSCDINISRQQVMTTILHMYTCVYIYYIDMLHKQAHLQYTYTIYNNMHIQ